MEAGLVIFRKNIGQFLETDIDGESVLMKVDTGRFNALKDTGRAIWQAIDGHRDLAAIAALLAESHDIDPQDCAADVDAFLSELEQAGFVIAA
ncbi:PqqD family protein [Sphingomonas sp. QA11]|uniref:PqqD family protein n=1 Tax=Sphingomonas sp. QA11 TaxID=2950605 RepID=UPI00234B13B2|nr:PqqD family protein [Sphingomonas sp. QA11]WCM28757.1 PqqD family protein [Sphingomonas sp. QA11]